MKRMKGFTLIELLIVVAIIAILAAIAVPNFLEAQVRSKVSRVKADQRSLATGLEAYFEDNNDFPAYAIGNAGCNGFAGAITPAGTAGGSGAGKILTFRVWNSTAQQNQFMTLTTPQAYITNYFADPFADSKGCIFAYYKDTNGWIISSFGPDTDEKDGGNIGMISPYEIETIYTSTQSQPSTYLLVGSKSTGGATRAFTYDPTNGTITPGDVYRVKQ